MRGAMRAARGFTLIEMMVAAGILGLVVAGVMQTFVAQNHAYTVVDQTTEAQQNLRAIGNLLEHDLRATGFMVPEGAAACATDLTNGPDTLWVTDADPINPAAQTRPQLGATVTGYTGALGLKTINTNGVVLDGTPFYDNNGDGVADADFRVNAGVILIDADSPNRGTACGLVTAVNPGANTLTVDWKTSIGAPPVGERIVVVPAHVYAIAQRGPAANPTFTLTRDGRDLAADVEDLQVAFFFDADNNGQMGAAVAENPGSAAGNPYVSSAWDHRQLREVRLNVVVRSRDPDPGDRQGLGQATENRGPAALADSFRRRVHTATVRLRNVGFRGVAS